MQSKPTIKRDRAYVRMGAKLKAAAEKKANAQEKTISEYIRDLIEADLKNK